MGWAYPSSSGVHCGPELGASCIYIKDFPPSLGKCNFKQSLCFTNWPCLSRQHHEFFFTSGIQLLTTFLHEMAFRRWLQRFCAAPDLQWQTLDYFLSLSFLIMKRWQYWVAVWDGYCRECSWHKIYQIPFWLLLLFCSMSDSQLKSLTLQGKYVLTIKLEHLAKH